MSTQSLMLKLNLIKENFLKKTTVYSICILCNIAALNLMSHDVAQAVSFLFLISGGPG
jgi:hypothetical protein